MTQKRISDRRRGFVATRMIDHLDRCAADAYQVHASSTDILAGGHCRPSCGCAEPILCCIWRQSHTRPRVRQPELTAQVNFDGTRHDADGVGSNRLCSARWCLSAQAICIAGAGVPICRLRNPAAPAQPLQPAKAAAGPGACSTSLHCGLLHCHGARFNHIGRGQSAQFVLPPWPSNYRHRARGQRPPVRSRIWIVTRDFHQCQRCLTRIWRWRNPRRGEVYNVCPGLNIAFAIWSNK